MALGEYLFGLMGTFKCNPRIISLRANQEFRHFCNSFVLTVKCFQDSEVF